MCLSMRLWDRKVSKFVNQKECNCGATLCTMNATFCVTCNEYYCDECWDDQNAHPCDEPDAG